MDPIHENLNRIQQLCREHHIARLELFGSATRASLDRPPNDYDFLYAFDPALQSDYAKHFFAFESKLEQLLGRPVDLVDMTCLRNPYFMEVIQPQRRVIHGT